MIVKQVNGKNLFLLGSLPGYNDKIDTNNFDLEKDLLHNISFIDLFLATYSISADSGVQKTKNGKPVKLGIIKETENFIKGVLSSNQLYNYKLVGNGDEIQKVFNALLKKYLNYTSTSKNFINGIRIIASSDSMTTETIANNFGDSMLHNMINQSKIMNGLGKASFFQNAIKELDFNAAWKMFSALGSKKSQGMTGLISDFLSAKSLGLKIAFPKFYESSTYGHNMSIFFKLTSPSGDEKIIDELIFKPLKLIMIMAAPNSLNGKSFAYPFIYRVNAYGNSYLTLGYISDITISRGSMETVYSDDFLPLSIDVRLNIKTLSDNFANIVNATNKKDKLNNINNDFKNIGLTTPAMSSAIDINKNVGKMVPEEIHTLNL